MKLETEDLLAGEMPVSLQKQCEEPNKEFKLAPTPAQLGKAPLQRRQSMGKTFSWSKKVLLTSKHIF